MLTLKKLVFLKLIKSDKKLTQKTTKHLLIF